jgi:hypothetical protein
MISRFEPYRYTGRDKEKRSFELVEKDVNLNHPSERQRLRSNQKLKALSDKPGVYLWIMRCSHGEFKIYVGKAKSLPRRLEDYANKFQVHSPNDYKLRFFQIFLEETLGDLGASMDLYFLESTLDDYTNLETEVINQYEPFINKSSRLDGRAIDQMQRHFKNHYDDIFRRKLGLPLNPATTPQ